ncbi:MAG: PAS domain-containing protein [Patescibacteria group bacterium]
MKRKNTSKQALQSEAGFVNTVWESSWIYIKAVVDVVREPVLILDTEFRVMTANESFYRMFQVERSDTEGRIVYELGNGQWNIPALRKLLEDILPHNTFFKGFEVVHDFPFIGRKILMLNAREIHSTEDITIGTFPPIILLAMEDVTEIMVVAETFANHANQVGVKLTERTERLEVHIRKLEAEISELKAQL